MTSRRSRTTKWFFFFFFFFWGGGGGLMYSLYLIVLPCILCFKMYIHFVVVNKLQTSNFKLQILMFYICQTTCNVFLKNWGIPTCVCVVIYFRRSVMFFFLNGDCHMRTRCSWHINTNIEKVITRRIGMNASWSCTQITSIIHATNIIFAMLLSMTTFQASDSSNLVSASLPLSCYIYVFSSITVSLLRWIQ